MDGEPASAQEAVWAQVWESAVDLFQEDTDRREGRAAKATGG